MAKDKRLTDEDIDYRKRVADMEIAELKVKKDAVDFESKCRNLCSISVALSEFDRFLKPFVSAFLDIPDTIQSIVPRLTPAEYKKIEVYIQDTMIRMKDGRMHLSLMSTEQQRIDRLDYQHKAQEKCAAKKAEKAGMTDDG